MVSRQAPTPAHVMIMIMMMLLGSRIPVRAG